MKPWPKGASTRRSCATPTTGRKSSDGARSGRGEETVKIAKNHSDAIEAAAMAVAHDHSHYELRLYVAGQTHKSLTAFANLKKICEEHLANRYQIEVIDLLKQPQLAQGDQIVAV